jgi:hypothetical protein
VSAPPAEVGRSLPTRIRLNVNSPAQNVVCGFLQCVIPLHKIHYFALAHVRKHLAQLPHFLRSISVTTKPRQHTSRHIVTIVAVTVVITVVIIAVIVFAFIRTVDLCVAVVFIRILLTVVVWHRFQRRHRIILFCVLLPTAVVMVSVSVGVSVSVVMTMGVMVWRGRRLVLLALLARALLSLTIASARPTQRLDVRSDVEQMSTTVGARRVLLEPSHEARLVKEVRAGQLERDEHLFAANGAAVVATDELIARERLVLLANRGAQTHIVAVRGDALGELDPDETHVDSDNQVDQRERETVNVLKVHEVHDGEHEYEHVAA